MAAATTSRQGVAAPPCQQTAIYSRSLMKLQKLSARWRSSRRALRKLEDTNEESKQVTRAADMKGEQKLL